MKRIITLLVGERTSGEAVAEPTFRTTTPSNMPPTYFMWAADLKVGSMLDKRSHFFSY